MRYFLEIVFTVLLITIFVGAQRQGDPCVVAGTNLPGVCRDILKCSVALEAAFKGIPHQECASPENRLIVCCPWVPGQETGPEARCQANTIIPREGDNCTMVDTRRAGVCSQFVNCQTAKEAAYKGIFPQTCGVEGAMQIVCCPLVTVFEGDNCTMVDTGRAGVCRPFANCQTAKDASHKGIFPQTCNVEGTIQIVCCPLVMVVEGSNCSLKDTGKAGVYTPFANCQTAVKAASKGILPEIRALEDTVQIVCCPPVTVEGSNCTVKNTGIAGVCRPFANCQRAMKAAGRGVAPQKCDLSDKESELVCCPEADCPPLPKSLLTQLPIGSKAADYCRELAEKIHRCQETPSGWTRVGMCPLLTPDPNIEYNRTPMTTTAEAPYYGQIGQGQRGDIDWQGSSVSLVSERWVVCAARSVASSDFSTNFFLFVGLGGTFTPRYNPDETYGVAKKYIHPLYTDYSQAYNDIALLRLDREVTYTNRILPACLNTGIPLPDSGFIFTAYFDSPEYKSTMLRLSEDECSRVFRAGSERHPAGVKHDLEICSRPINTTGECPGWYGGAPLTLPTSPGGACTHLLVGLAAGYTSKPCTYTYTRISGFIPWIEGIVWSETTLF